jgi:hypothetical protein
VRLGFWGRHQKEAHGGAVSLRRPWLLQLPLSRSGEEREGVEEKEVRVSMKGAIGGFVLPISVEGRLISIDD